MDQLPSLSLAIRQSKTIRLPCATRHRELYLGLSADQILQMAGGRDIDQMKHRSMNHRKSHSVQTSLVAITSYFQQQWIPMLVSLFILSHQTRPAFLQITKECRPEYWLCMDGRACIRKAWICDEIRDCYDFSDEWNCTDTMSTISTSITPSTTTDPPFSFINTSSHGSEDNSTATACRSDQFKCLDALACIHLSRVCDRIQDCADNSDEYSCSSLSPPTTRIALDIADSLNGTTFDSAANTLMITTTTPTTTSDPPSTATTTTKTRKLTPTQSKIASTKLSSPSFRTTSDPQPRNLGQSLPACSWAPSWVMCYNLACVSSARLCDGVNDCGDNSDERYCQVTTVVPDEPFATTSSKPTTNGSLKPPIVTPAVEKSSTSKVARRTTPPKSTKGSTSATKSSQASFTMDGSTRLMTSSTTMTSSSTTRNSPTMTSTTTMTSSSSTSNSPIMTSPTTMTSSSSTSNSPTMTSPTTMASSSSTSNSLTMMSPTTMTSPSSTSNSLPMTSTTTMTSSSRIINSSSMTSSTTMTSSPSAINTPTMASTTTTASTPASSTGIVQTSPMTSSQTSTWNMTSYPTSSSSTSDPTVASSTVWYSTVTYSLPVCPTEPAFVRCQNSICIPPGFICDGFDDCGDNSDEKNCQVCLENEFQCSNGGCVSTGLVCNAEDNCGDSSDEMACPAVFTTTTTRPTTTESVQTCRRLEYRCVNSQCIPVAWICDGVPDCEDGSDETLPGCPTRACPVGQLQCPNGNCVMPWHICNRIDDCLDQSDETNCSFVWTPPPYWNWTTQLTSPRFNCSSSTYKCRNGKCVPNRWLCDGDDDCGDSSDESNCKGCVSIAPEKRFYCWNRDCISQAAMCNGIADCVDGSDEIGCYCDYAKTRVACAAGVVCVNVRQWCDGQIDCIDGSDEANCSTVQCPKGSRRCNATGQCLPPSYTCNNLPDCPDFSDEANCSCPAGFGFRCRHPGICVSTGSWCNGVADCADGSDEPLNCSSSCAPNQFTCRNDACVDLPRVCDSIDDCGDWTDEINCPCKTTDFRCMMGICIEQTNLCDGVMHCPDNTDELLTNCLQKVN